MDDITAGYKIRIRQWRHEIRLHCRILILYPALYFMSRMPVLTTFSSFVHPDRTVQRCDCREKSSCFMWEMPWNGYDFKVRHRRFRRKILYGLFFCYRQNAQFTTNGSSCAFLFPILPFGSVVCKRNLCVALLFCYDHSEWKVLLLYQRKVWVLLHVWICNKLFLLNSIRIEYNKYSDQFTFAMKIGQWFLISPTWGQNKYYHYR